MRIILVMMMIAIIMLVMKAMVMRWWWNIPNYGDEDEVSPEMGEGDFGLECEQEEKKLAGIFLLFDFLFRLEIEGVGGRKTFSS